jgi:diguanylate cyclase (GGDEF)-like protein/PAS domain S-box-containing protein
VDSGERCRFLMHLAGRMLIESVSEAIAVVDGAGSILFLNENAARYLGSSRDELAGTRLHELLAPSDVEICMGQVGKVLDSGNPFLGEAPLTIGQDERLFSFRLDLIPECRELQKSVLVTAEDVTARRSAETEIRRLARIPEESPHPIIRASRDGRILYQNGPARQMMAVEDAAPSKTGDLLPASWQQRVVEALDAATTLEWDIEQGSGYYHVVSVPVPDKGYVNFYLTDITERRRAEDQLRLAAKVFDTTSDAIFVTDAKGDIRDVNAAFETVTGYSRETVIGRNPRMFRSGVHGDDFYHGMWTSLLSTGSWQGEIWDRRQNGEVYPKWMSINALKDSEGRTTHYVSVFNDISTLKQTELQLERMAHYDPLTQLPNRILFQDRLMQALEHAARNDSQVALFFLDLDRFKNINDTLGHRAGDLLLMEVGQRLRERLRAEDTVARLGGDEFTFILPEIQSISTVARIAEKTLNALSMPFELEGQEVFISASIGITVFPQDGGDVETMVRNADTAMYHAKHKGKNTFEFYTRVMNEEAQERMRIDTLLRGALGRDELSLVFQPRRNLRSGLVVGAEALIRWASPVLGDVPPSRFIPVAEETGEILRIGEWALRTACGFARQWQDRCAADLRMAVNLSPRQFWDENLVNAVREALDASGLQPELLELEITEGSLIENVERTGRTLTELKAMGVVISVDDFGTGYSSLSYLRRFPLGILKVDQSFVRELPDQADDAAITRAILAMAHSLNLEVIAEGVENDRQVEFLREGGCDQAQGFHIGRPVSAREFQRLYLTQLEADKASSI